MLHVITRFKKNRMMYGKSNTSKHTRGAVLTPFLKPKDNVTINKPNKSKQCDNAQTPPRTVCKCITCLVAMYLQQVRYYKHIRNTVTFYLHEDILL